MGRKTQPSVTSGGVGISREVANIGGVSVTGGVSVEVSPIDLGINYDPTENSVSVAAGAEVPGGLLGVSGGVTVDIDTGEITGGRAGVEGLGLGVNISVSKDGGLRLGITLQIPFTPIEIELGFGFPPEKPPEEEPYTTPPFSPEIEKLLEPKKPKLPPYDDPANPPGWDPAPPMPPTPPLSDRNKICKMVVTVYSDRNSRYWNLYGSRQAAEGASYRGRASVKYDDNGKLVGGGVASWINTYYWETDSRIFDGVSVPPINQKYDSTPPLSLPPPATYFPWNSNVYPYDINKQPFVRRQLAGYEVWEYWGVEYSIYDDIRKQTYIRAAVPKTYERSSAAWWFWFSFSPSYQIYSIEAHWCPKKPGFDSPPFPNPPPRKRNMDECCRESTKLLRLLVRHAGAERSSTQETLPNGVKAVGSSQDGIRQAYPFIVRKRWVDPNAKENEGIPILNDRQLALVLGGMIERLERVLGTAEFYKDPDNKLRQSEGNLTSWLTGKNKDFKYPDPNDFWMNTDDGVINEKLLEVRSIADGLRYQIEALNRLERILPIAELKDSSIPKRWISPGAKGQERVGNLIHLIELMIRADDRQRGYWPVKVKVKDADPAIKGDQPVSLEFHSQADVFRELFQYLIDMEGDGDLTSNFALRSAFQQCQIHQLTVKNNSMLDAIVEYLDFKVKQTKTVVPMPFDPFAGVDRSAAAVILQGLGLMEGVGLTPNIDSNKEADIEALAPNVLRNTHIDVDIIECNESKTLNEALLELLKHSSAASAAVSERVSESAIDRVIEGAGLAQQLTSFLTRRDVASALGVGDLDKWISSAELGYTDLPESDGLRFPESDLQQPYGRPTSENPRIREIDTKEPKAD
jgi:hypothetical protein